MRAGWLITFLTACAACGPSAPRSSPTASPASTQSPTRAVAAVPGAPPIRISHRSAPKDVTAAVADALVRAGYDVAVDHPFVVGDAAWALDLTVVGTVAPLPGGRDLAYGVDVVVTFHAQNVDHVRISFVGAPGAVGANEVEPIVRALVEHGALAAFVAEHRARNEARAAKEGRDAAEAQRARDETWARAQPERCRELATDEACRLLVEWQTTHREDPRAAEASAIMAATAARRDEAAWASAGVNRCRAPKKVDDCYGVVSYLEGHRSGAHVKEAEDVLDAVAATRRVLAEREEAARLARKRVGCRSHCAREPSPGCESICMADPER